MRFLLSLLALSLITASAVSQPYYARGTFTITPWDTSVPMTEVAPGHYSAQVTGLFDNEAFLFKLADENYTVAGPANDGRVTTNAAGEINFHLYTNTSWSDGYFPNDTVRVGYDDHQQFDWEIAGNFNQFNGGAPWFLTDQGNGLHTGQFQFDAGSYEFKFRQQGSWDTSIGNGDFSNSGGNNEFRVWEDGETWNFELDLPNGRWTAFTNAVSPDLNNDQYVDASDYVLWRKLGGSQAQYDSWKKHYGEGPPPPPPGWYARGTFTTPNWDDLSQEMVDQGGGYYTRTVTGLTPGTNYDYKIARSDWSQSVPGNNGSVAADANGEINFHFWETTTWSDGWSPTSSRRVGYDDHQQFDWQLMASFSNNFGTPIAMTDLGNGLHRSADVVLTAGTHEFKFRKENDWSINIGADFGNGGANAVLTLAAGTWAFELDLPNGRWRAVEVTAGSGGAVPEPGTVALLAIGSLMALIRVRRN